MADGFMWMQTKAPLAGSRTDDIWFHDENIGWAVNSDGQILATRDGFETYDVQAHLKGNYLRCIAFANETVGWVGTLDREAENERLYRTIDGGRHWEQVTNLPEGAPGRICGLSVVDEQTLFAAGTNYPNEESAVLKSLDGGSSWTVTNIAGQAAILVDVLFLNAMEGWVVGGKDVVKHPGRDPVRDDVIACVLHTRDGGISWTSLLDPIEKYLPRGEWGWKIQRIDEQTIVVALENFTDGAILRSDDGGASWRRIPLNDRQRNANLEGIGFLDRNTGWVGGWGDRDFKGGYTSVTRDGGQTWDDANEVGFRINRFRFIGDPVRVGYASGQGIYRYSDAPLHDALLKAQKPERVSTVDATQALEFEVEVPAGTLKLTARAWEQFGRAFGPIVEIDNPAAGPVTINWDFTDATGAKVDADAFLIRITFDDQSTSRAVVRKREATEQIAEGDTLPPDIDPKSGLGLYWNQNVSALASVGLPSLGSDAAERHAIYSLLTLALLDAYFNGNKEGAEGEYPWREKQRRANGSYEGDRYIGHNIACIAVDENGDVVDFDFNHNELYNSSAEHAEARLIRRVFSLNQIYDKWELWGPAKKAVPYGTTLSGMTVYTSLESCAQCSGIMTLANALQVVFLQTDPGQYRIGNMLYNLTRPIKAMLKSGFFAEGRPKPPEKYGAPAPIDASSFGFSYKDDLDKAYQDFADNVSDAKPFWIPPGGGNPRKSRSITSFLCTDAAKEVFARAAKDLATLKLAYPNYRPTRSDGEIAGVKSNAEALEHVRGFFHHAVTLGRRGTPHR